MTDPLPPGNSAPEPPQTPSNGTADKPAAAAPDRAKPAAETGGPKGPEPTRYGDWERKGRCIDF